MKKTNMDIVIDPVAWRAHRDEQIKEVNETLESLMGMGVFSGDAKLQSIMEQVTEKSRAELNRVR